MTTKICKQCSETKSTYIPLDISIPIPYTSDLLERAIEDNNIPIERNKSTPEYCNVCGYSKNNEGICKRCIVIKRLCNEEMDKLDNNNDSEEDEP